MLVHKLYSSYIYIYTDDPRGEGRRPLNDLYYCAASSLTCKCVLEQLIYCCLYLRPTQNVSKLGIPVLSYCTFRIISYKVVQVYGYTF